MSSYYRFHDVDSYDTPDNVKKSWLFPLLGHCRAYFYFDNFHTFAVSGMAARRGKLDKDAQIRFSSRNLDLIERCGGKIHLRGLNFLRSVADRPVVVIANHMSLLETGILHAICREYLDFSFVIKESLMHTAFMKDILKSFDAIPVTRNNPREDLKAVLTHGKRILSGGRSIIIFPQATRSATFNPEGFSSLGVKLAQKAGVPILPLALKTDIVGNGRGKLKDLGPIDIKKEVWFEFDAPQEISDDAAAHQKKIINFIADRVNYWRKLEEDNRK